MAHVRAVLGLAVVGLAQCHVGRRLASAQLAHQVKACLGFQMPVPHSAVVAHKYEVIRVDAVEALAVDVAIGVAQQKQDAGGVSLHHCVDAGGNVIDVGVLFAVFHKVHAEFCQAEVGDAHCAVDVLDVGDFGLHLLELVRAVS